LPNAAPAIRRSANWRYVNRHQLLGGGLIGAGVIASLMAVEFFGKKLRKP
jgi:hypothetical protein